MNELRGHAVPELDGVEGRLARRARAGRSYASARALRPGTRRSDQRCAVRSGRGGGERSPWSSGSGSGSVTSSPAPARWPARITSRRSSVATRGPRATLIRYALVLHPHQRIAIDQTPGGVGQGRAEDDDVGPRKRVIEVHEPHRYLGNAIGIRRPRVRDDLHPEPMAEASEVRADVAEADDARGSSRRAGWRGCRATPARRAASPSGRGGAAGTARARRPRGPVAPGTFVTVMPRRVAAATSMLSTPAPGFATSRSSGARARSSPPSRARVR